MADQYVDCAFIKVKREGEGLVELEEGSKLSIKRTKSRKVVNTMNRRRVGKGYRSATKAVTFELEIPRTVNGTEVPWVEMFDKDEIFHMPYEMGDGGQRRSLIDCIVDSADDDFSEDGEAVLRIAGMALDDVED
jgi:hypothetical protein